MMSESLKEKLDALSESATSGHWQVDIKGGKPYSHYSGPMAFRFKEKASNLRLSSILVNAYRSGVLVTREELDEAVTQALQEAASPKVKPITFQEAISIVEDTEVAEMTEEEDRRWTRRMAEALMQAANARILSALSQTK